MKRSYEVIEDHMVLVVGHHSVGNNRLHPNLHILVRCMVRNSRHPWVDNMDEYIRLDVDEKQSHLRNVTGPHTFLNIKYLLSRATEDEDDHDKNELSGSFLPSPPQKKTEEQFCGSSKIPFSPISSQKSSA